MVSVIIVNFNAGQYLNVSLSGLRDAARCEVIVVDNGSEDPESAAARRAHPWVRWIQLDANVGFGAANNIGARAARGDVLLLLNPDAFADPTVPAQVESLYRRDPTVGAIGFRQVDLDGHWQLSIGIKPSIMGELLRKALQDQLDQGSHRVGRLMDRWLSQRTSVSWVAGSALALSRKAYWCVGGFDERFFLYFEDIDLCLRLKEAVGEVVYEPSLTVKHVRGASAKVAPEASRAHYRRSQCTFWSLHGRGYFRTHLMQRYARFRLHHRP